MAYGATRGTACGTTEVAMRRVSSLLSASFLTLFLLFCVPAQCFSQAAPANVTANAETEQELLTKFKDIQGRGTLPDVKSDVIEQPQGRIWRTFHEVYLRWIAAGAIFGILAVLTAYYLWHGTIRFEGGWSGRKIPRFTAWERFVHWLSACSFLVLAITGLNFTFGKKVLLPWMGPENFSAWASAAKHAHNFTSFSFTLGVFLMFMIWVRNNLPQRVDIEWLRRGGGMFGGKEPPAGRFNPGEKFIFWMSVVAGAIVSVSGYVLLFPFWGTGIKTMQFAQMTHSLVGVLFIAGMFVHMYMGTIGTEGAFGSMISGDVDENWAKSHHPVWYAQEAARRAKDVSAAHASTKLNRRAWGIGLLSGLAGLIIGAAAIVVVNEANLLTSTDALCTSCHTMNVVAIEPHFQNSLHRHNRFGAIATCSDCHIPRTNWFVETYTHISKGVRDVIAEQIGGFQDPAAWARRRTELVTYAISEMRASESATCRSCHVTSAIVPESDLGKAAHQSLVSRKTNCVDCHSVHSQAQ